MQMHKIIVEKDLGAPHGHLLWRWTIWEDEGTSYTSEIFYPTPEVAMAAAMLEITSTRAGVSGRYDVAKAYEPD